MKKVKLLLLMVFAIAITFTSCKDDEDAVKPTVTVTAFTDDAMENSADPADYSPGAVIYYKVAATASNNDELKSLTVAFDAQYGTGVLTEDDVKGNTTKDSQFAFTIASSANPNGTTEVTLTFNLEDDDATLAHEVKFTVVAATGGVSSQPGLSLSYSSTSLTVTSGYDGTTTASAPSDKTLFAICWQNDQSYSIVSPNSDWLASLYLANNKTYATSDKKDTKFKIATVTDYESADYLGTLDIGTSETVGTGTNKNGINNVAAGKYIAFQSGDVKGIIKIISVSGVKVTTSMSFDVKVLGVAK